MCDPSDDHVAVHDLLNLQKPPLALLPNTKNSSAFCVSAGVWMWSVHVHVCVTVCVAVYVAVYVAVCD